MGYWQSCKHFSLMAIAATTIAFSHSLNAAANTPDTAPANLTQLLDKLEQAANGHQLDQLLALYGANFENSDGLDKTAFRKLLTELWKKYPRMTYDTELLSWEQDGDRLVAETQTTVVGLQKQDGRWSHLESKIRSKQYFANQQLVQQDILAESSELSSGDNPPSVRVLIPETVAPKEDFGFDVIVRDPLNDDILLGGAVEEPISKATYTAPEGFALDILPAGGIFKRVEAPETAGDVLYSALIVRSDGMILVSHRVKVEKNN